MTATVNLTDLRASAVALRRLRRLLDVAKRSGPRVGQSLVIRLTDGEADMYIETCDEAAEALEVLGGG